MEHTDQMVVAARSGAWSGFQEIVDQRAVNGFPTGDGALTQIVVQEPKRRHFGPVLTIQYLLVLDKISQGFR